MEKEFVPYNLALRLKQLGFDEPCFGWYSNMDGNPLRLGYCETYLGIENCVKAPTFSQAFRWFRKELEKSAIEPYDMEKHYSYNMKVSWEEAEIACLDKLLEIVELKQNKDENTNRITHT